MVNFLSIEFIPHIGIWPTPTAANAGSSCIFGYKEFIIIDIEKKLLFKFGKYPVPLFSMLPRLHPVSATRRQGLILRKVYGKCDWGQVAETGCKRGRLENKGTGFEASLHPLVRVWVGYGACHVNIHRPRRQKMENWQNLVAASWDACYSWYEDSTRSSPHSIFELTNKQNRPRTIWWWMQTMTTNQRSRTSSKCGK
jgi:hypothetical protein